MPAVLRVVASFILSVSAFSVGGGNEASRPAVDIADTCDQTDNGQASPSAMLQVGGRRAIRAVVGFDQVAEQLEPSSSAMIDRLRGVASVLDSQELNQLANTFLPSTRPVELTADWRRVFVIRLDAALRPEQAEAAAIGHLEILESPAGDLVARRIDAPSRELAIRVRRAGFFELVRVRSRARVDGGQGWSIYRGELNPPNTGQEVVLPPAPGDEPNDSVLIDGGGVPGWVTLDRATIADRLLRGSTGRFEPASRELRRESFHARVPQTYHCSGPAGLVVWIHPATEGTIPAALAEAADELGLIVIAPAAAGNTRQLATRCQLAFDAVATASERWHVDPARVYIAGLSGGGRVASVLVGAWSDEFAGAACICGLNGYRAITAPFGGRWPALYARPRTRLFDLLKSRRIAAVTGRRDGNLTEIATTAMVLKGDGVNIRVFEWADLGHELPDADRLVEVLGWIDEPTRALADQARAHGERELRAFTDLHGDLLAYVAAPLTDNSLREKLMRITRRYPWTPAAWKAAATLAPDAVADVETTRPPTPEKP